MGDYESKPDFDFGRMMARCWLWLLSISIGFLVVASIVNAFKDDLPLLGYWCGLAVVAVLTGWAIQRA